MYSKLKFDDENQSNLVMYSKVKCADENRLNLIMFSKKNCYGGKRANLVMKNMGTYSENRLNSVMNYTREHGSTWLRLSFPCLKQPSLGFEHFPLLIICNNETVAHNYKECYRNCQGKLLLVYPGSFLVVAGRSKCGNNWWWRKIARDAVRTLGNTKVFFCPIRRQPWSCLEMIWTGPVPKGSSPLTWIFPDFKFYCVNCILPQLLDR